MISASTKFHFSAAVLWHNEKCIHSRIYYASETTGREGPPGLSPFFNKICWYASHAAINYKGRCFKQIAEKESRTYLLLPLDHTIQESLQGVLEILDSFLLKSSNFQLYKLRYLLKFEFRFRRSSFSLHKHLLEKQQGLKYVINLQTSAIRLRECPNRSAGIRPWARFFSWVCFVRNKSLSADFHE